MPTIEVLGAQRGSRNMPKFLNFCVLKGLELLVGRREEKMLTSDLNIILHFLKCVLIKDFVLLLRNI